MDSRSKRAAKTVPGGNGSSEMVPPPILEQASTILIDGSEHTLVDIRATGDVVLDVSFENQKSNVRLPSPQPGLLKPASLIKGVKTPSNRVLYRVKLETLKKTSKYFEMLLSNETFEEGRRIKQTFDNLHARGVDPSEALAEELPRITITDDDDSTRTAGREHVFGDMLRILHAGDIVMRSTISYLAVMAVMSDLYDCTPTIARYVRASKRTPWPNLQGNVTPAVEEVMRQKVLVSWLLDDQVKLASATKELILRGSSRWVTEQVLGGQNATWWELGDGLESELQYRRSCIASAIWSLQRHFIQVYSSKVPQCKLFYGNSTACDSYSLGEIVKFFLGKGLLSLVSPLSSDDDYPEAYGGDVETLIQILRQCPSYQIDQNHRHCGMRTRIMPALDFIQSMLTANIGIDRRGWKTDRPSTSWEKNGDGGTFRFLKGIAGDQRLKLDGLIVGNRHAKAFFTASEWDWSPEEEGEKHDPNARLGRFFGSMSGI